MFVSLGALFEFCVFYLFWVSFILLHRWFCFFSFCRIFCWWCCIEFWVNATMSSENDNAAECCNWYESSGDSSKWIGSCQCTSWSHIKCAVLSGIKSGTLMKVNWVCSPCLGKCKLALSSFDKICCISSVTNIEKYSSYQIVNSFVQQSSSTQKVIRRCQYYKQRSYRSGNCRSFAKIHPNLSLSPICERWSGYDSRPSECCVPCYSNY